MEEKGSLMKLRKQPIITFCLIICLLTAIFFGAKTGSLPALHAAAQAPELRTTLTDNTIQKGSRKTFDVWAKNAAGEKITATVTLNGESVSPVWDDNEKTSYTLFFTKEGENTVTVSASDNGSKKELTYRIYYQKAQKGEVIGSAVWSIELFTAGCGYLIAPTVQDVLEGETAAEALVRLLRENGYVCYYGGTPKAGFYLSYIAGGNNASASYSGYKRCELPAAPKALTLAPRIPSILTPHLQSTMTYFDPDDYENWGGHIGEFVFTNGSGWMFSVNHVFPNVGFSDTYLSDEDIIRVQFTLAYGADIGGLGSVGGNIPGGGVQPSAGYFDTADKDALTLAIAEARSSGLLTNEKVRNAYEAALSTVQTLDAAQAQTDAAAKRLTEALENAKNGETASATETPTGNTTAPAGSGTPSAGSPTPAGTAAPKTDSPAGSTQTALPTAASETDSQPPVNTPEQGETAPPQTGDPSGNILASQNASEKPSEAPKNTTGTTGQTDTAGTAAAILVIVFLLLAAGGTGGFFLYKSRKHGKKTTALLLIICLLTPAIFGNFVYQETVLAASAAGTAQIDEILSIADGIIRWKKRDNGAAENEYLMNDTFLALAGSTPGDWFPIGLGRLGIEDNYDAYLAVLKDHVEARYREAGKLSAAKATEWHRIILAVLSAGGDPTSFGTRENGDPINLVADGTYDRGKTTSLGRQGLNGWIWGLIALDSMRYPIPEDAYYTREDIITEILCKQLPDGGFALSGSRADADMTAMAIQALAPYYNDDKVYTVKMSTGENVSETVRQSVDAALFCLSAMQLETGDFESWGTQNIESTNQVIVALCCLGIDPLSDTRFIKNGSTLLDGLKRYQMADGGFTHSFVYDAENPDARPGESNSMACEQTLYTMAALYRQANGMRTLYDFRPEQNGENTENTVFLFTEEDRAAVHSLPETLTTEQYVLVTALLDKLHRAEDFAEKEFYLEKLTNAKNTIAALQVEIDDLNEEIKNKLYPLDKLTLADKNTVDEIAARCASLSEYDRAKIEYAEDVLRAKTTIDNMLRGIVIGTAAGLLALLLITVLILRIKKRRKRKEGIFL